MANVAARFQHKRLQTTSNQMCGGSQTHRAGTNDNDGKGTLCHGALLDALTIKV